MICKKCGEENKDAYGFCTNCGVNLKSLQPDPLGSSANAPPNEKVEIPSSAIVASTPISSGHVVSPPADPIDQTIAVPTFASNLSYREPKGSSNKVLFIAGAALGFVFFLIVGGGVFVWWQMQKNGEQTNTDQNVQVNGSPRKGANPAPDSTSSNTNVSQYPTADDEFTRLQSKLKNAAPNGTNSLDAELKNAESNYPSDFRFTYLRAKIETVTSKGHHEAFEMLFKAGEKAIKADRSADLLGDLQKDKYSDLKRLTDHKEWKDLGKTLRNRDAKALEVKGH